MMNIINLIIPIFGLIFLGFITAKFRKHHERGLDWLNTFVIYLALPAFFYKLLSQTPFEQLTNWKFVTATTASTFITFALIITISVLLYQTRLAEAAIRGAAASYGNVAYMGPGLTIAALGNAAAVPTTLIICFDNLLFFTAIPLLVALSGEQKQSFTATLVEICRKVLLHPFILASIAGILAAYSKYELPAPIFKITEYLSSAAAPCALFALGVTIAAQPLRRITSDIPILLIAKLILQPILVYFILVTFVKPDAIWLMTAVIMAALPPAANVFVLAQQYNAYVQRASSTILISTGMSVVTISIILYWIEAVKPG